MVREPPSLHELQARVHAAATSGARTPGALSSDAGDLLELIEGDDSFPADARLAVYARMYVDRLVDALSEDYPKVRVVLGDEAFVAAAERYLHAYPPHHPSIRFAGDRFPAFLAGDDPRPWLPELARLELARLDVFDAADDTPLRLDDVRAMDPTAFAQRVLRWVRAHAIVEVAWSIDETWRAIEEAEATRAFDFVPPAPEPRTILVFRQGVVVRHRALDREEARALVAACGGIAFGDLCEALAREHSADEARELAFEWMGRWLACELLV
ncbi:MAG: putative DNA-binding domain-containing protein [Deltaproteobacteria bacterium]|nr:putative DNA-binding domain-containing protein [Deltaproteobacteria bacterium]